MKQTSLYVLIAMWLWCVSAAGETLPISVQSLQENNYQASVTVPCNWNKDISTVTVTGIYANPGEYTDVRSYSIMDRASISKVPIIPTSIRDGGNQIFFAFDPGMPMTDEGKYLYHLNVEVPTTNTRCKEGFGFGFGTR